MLKAHTIHIHISNLKYIKRKDCLFEACFIAYKDRKNDVLLASMQTTR